MYRPPSLAIIACTVAVAFALGGCASTSPADSASPVSSVPPTSATAATTTAAVASTTLQTAATTTTEAAEPRDEDWVFADPALLMSVAATYCDLWPDVGSLLAESVVLVDVPRDGWTVGRDLTDDLPAGDASVTAAIGETGVVSAECSEEYVVSGDWIAVPVTMSAEDGSTEGGLWSLQVSPTGMVHWHFITASSLESEGASSDPEIEQAAWAFCDLFEGIGERDPNAILDAMVDDPAIHNIINKRHYIGSDGVAAMVPQYLPEERITCGPITTNGSWSANAWALDNEGVNIHLVGLTLQKHDGDLIERQYVSVTQLTGATGWGDYIWGADAAGRHDS